MCFSPQASFISAGLTGAIGLIAISRVTHRRELALAATPLLFGMQQAFEGGVWLSLPRAPHGIMATALTVAFLLFAQVFWPVYAPFAAGLNETVPVRRRMMHMFMLIGAVVSAYFLWRIISGPHQAVIANRCIVYNTGETHPLVIGLAYMAATCLPLLLSSERTLVILGVIVSVGAVVAYLFYWEAFLSVWCFFGAAASVVILGHFEHVHWRGRRLVIA
jgi:hypothetical protein